MSDLYQLPSYPLALISNIHREVGKITAIMKVRHRAGDTDEQLTVPSRDDKIGMLDHPLKTMDVINRAPFVKSGAQQDISKTIR